MPSADSSARRPDAPLFEFDEVEVRHRDRDGTENCRLARISATIADRRLTCLAGPSGSGKSTFLRCCNRLVVPTSGRVYFRGTDVAELDPLALRRRVGMVFQRPTPFPGTVADNLREADPDLDRRSIGDLLERAQLDADAAARIADSLSGGEAQRMCLARTLATRPEVLLMDEPTSALDAVNRDAVEQVTRELVASGIAVLWVSHDPHQIERLADDVVEFG